MAKEMQNQSVFLKNDFKKLQKEIGAGASLIELTDEKGENALTHVQAIQINPISKQIEHIDFHEVARGQSFVAHVPVHLNGLLSVKAFEMRVALLIIRP